MEVGDCLNELHAGTTYFDYKSHPQTVFCFGITGSFLQEYVIVIKNIKTNTNSLMIIKR